MKTIYEAIGVKKNIFLTAKLEDAGRSMVNEYWVTKIFIKNCSAHFNRDVGGLPVCGDCACMALLGVLNPSVKETDMWNNKWHMRAHLLSLILVYALGKWPKISLEDFSASLDYNVRRDVGLEPRIEDPKLALDTCFSHLLQYYIDWPNKPVCKECLAEVWNEEGDPLLVQWCCSY